MSEFKILLPTQVSIPKYILEIISRAHQDKSTSLEFGVPQNENVRAIEGMFEIVDQKVRFPSIQTRNHCLALGLYQESKEQGKADDISHVFETASGLWLKEISSSDSACGRYLAFFHRDSDLFGIALALCQEVNGHQMYQLVSCCVKALPYIERLDIDTLIVFLDSVSGSGQEACIGWAFFEVLGGYFSHNPDQAHLLLNGSRGQSNLVKKDANVGALFGLSSGGDPEEAKTLTLSRIECEDSTQVVMSIEAIVKQFSLWEKANLKTGDVQAVIKKLALSSDDRVAHSALRAMENLVTSIPSFIDELLHHANSGKSEAINALSRITWLSSECVLARTDFPDILDQLTEIDYEQVSLLDSVFSTLLSESERFDCVFRCFTKWLVKAYRTEQPEILIEQSFPQTIAKIVEMDLLSALVTRWLNSEERSLGPAVQELTSYLWVINIRELELDKQIIDELERDDLLYLIRRMLGWIYHHELLLSLTLSLVNTSEAAARTFGWVNTILVEHIGRDYPNATLEAVDFKIKDSDEKTVGFFTHIKSELNQYISRINQLTPLSELTPPRRLSKAIYNKQRREYRDGQEQGESNSTLSQLATRIPLKAGTGSFSFFNGEIGTISRLHSFSHSMTMPAVSVIDPVNARITGLGYRCAKRGEQ